MSSTASSLTIMLTKLAPNLVKFLVELAPGRALALVALVPLGATFVRRARFLRSLRDIPGPEYGFFLGASRTLYSKPSFFTQRHLALRDLHATYGPVVKIVLPAGRGALIAYAKAEDVAAAFKDVARFPMRPNGASAIGKGLLALPTGHTWRGHRAAMLPALSTKALRNYMPAILQSAEETCDLLEADGRASADVEVHAPLTAATLAIISRIGFGIEPGPLRAVMQCDLMAAGSSLLEGQVAMLAVPTPLVKAARMLPMCLMPTSQRKMFEGRRVYEAEARRLYEAIRARAHAARAGTAAEPALASDDARSLLEALAHAELPFDEVVDEIITLLIAGHETTANTMSWALLLLARHPEFQSRARAEIEAVTAGAPLDFEHLPRLELVRGCLFEALRLFPTVPNVVRVCVADARVGAHVVPAGASLLYSIAVAARDPEVMRDADAFEPERHGATADGNAWHPFGPQGPRRCLGYRLADAEGVAFLATVLRRFELREPSAAAPSPEEYTDATLGPKQSGLYLQLAPLKRAQSNSKAESAAA
jgi:cytochrome P450